MQTIKVYLITIFSLMSFYIDASECEDIGPFLEAYNANPILDAMSDYDANEIKFYIKRGVGFSERAIGLSEPTVCLINKYGEKLESPFDSLINYIDTDGIACDRQVDLWKVSNNYFELYNRQMAAKLRIYRKQCF